ncbi:MAG: tripartite tricarboxylate transporter TctB family protein, partial [Planctomycetes bacterium]|nr:tripartite tricarboxylate transporter TctB family protein [Planctomycetota bacterium]
FAYIQLIRPLGFILASTLFQLAAIPFFGYRRFFITAIFSAAVPLVVYVVFRHVFLVLIPTGTIF